MKRRKEKRRRQREPRSPGPSARLYLPLANAAELGELEQQTERAERRLAAWLRVLVALAVGLVLINLLTTFSSVEAPVPERVWSLLAILPLAAVAAIRWASVHLLRRRTLDAQNILLAQRELNRHAIGIKAAEERLRDRLERLSPRQGDLEAVLAAAERASHRLVRLADAGEADGDLLGRAARLDTYRVILDNVGIDALLDPELLRSAAASEALEAATRLLSESRSSTGSRS